VTAVGILRLPGILIWLAASCFVTPTTTSTMRPHNLCYLQIFAVMQAEARSDWAAAMLPERR
jgi:hypothetical protein